MTSRFDEIIDRVGTHSAKWDMMETIYGVSPEDGLAMWVADMDFRPPEVVQAAVQAMADHGVYGYFGGASAYNAAIAWWMENRHGWKIENVCYLQDLYARPEARGTGVGRALIEAVYAEADAMGCPSVYWMTQEFNHTARQLYDRVGQLTPFIKYQRP